MSIGVAIIGGGIFVREEHLVSTILLGSFPGNGR
jgi:hypothetical protein